MSELPQEVLALALDRAVPVTSPDLAARQLYDLAERQGDGFWRPLGYLAGRDPLLRGAWLRHDWKAGAPPMAIGTVRRLDAKAPAYFVVLDGGAVLRDGGRPLLFASIGRARRAAALGSASRRMQQFSSVVAAILAKPTEDISAADLPPYDAVMRRLRGAVRLAQEDWPELSSIAFPINANVGPKGREIIAEILSFALNTPAAAMTVQ
jgi:hypothetical protein